MIVRNAGAGLRAGVVGRQPLSLTRATGDTARFTAEERLRFARFHEAFPGGPKPRSPTPVSAPPLTPRG